ncbi:MAG: dTDP-4-amino-4,6-dideoxygalactose transaminase [Bacteroidales bacterium]|nr:dTDP-4-amino-4,6-dideoxygalactose transaminase [Bacteroidales bacterium]
MKNIPYNKPFMCGNETKYIKEAVKSGKISGNGYFTNKCQQYFETKYNFGKCLLTSSCTDALEMCALLANIEKDDEVIMPSYTFVSTALAFVRRGAKIIFVDSKKNNPNIDENEIEKNITPKTKVIVVVHYAGVACNMDKICEIAKLHNIMLIEDAAQAFDSYYKEKPLGSFGSLATFSFHETKNIISGEGGMLVINDPKLYSRAEIIWEKGTNRADFSRGFVKKYEWVDLGSSFLPSELISAFLYAQIEKADIIQKKRINIWEKYYKNLKRLEEKGFIKCAEIDKNCPTNGHIFYIICRNNDERTKLAKYLLDNNILAVSHYLGLHKSPYYKNQYQGQKLENCDKYEECLLRLPLYYELKTKEIDFICKTITEFYTKNLKV